MLSITYKVCLFSFSDLQIADSAAEEKRINLTSHHLLIRLSWIEGIIVVCDTCWGMGGGKKEKKEKKDKDKGISTHINLGSWLSQLLD